VGVSKAWEEPIHKTLKALRDKFKLTWLRILMSYHKFPSFREVLRGDLNKKVMVGIESEDFMDRECNCKPSKVKGESLKFCHFGGQCRKKVVVYKDTCLCCGKAYIGNTSRACKTRSQEHWSQVKKKCVSGKASDTFAKHFASHFDTKPLSEDIKKLSKFEILWQGDPISTS